MPSDHLVVGIAQMSPVWLNRQATTEKMLAFLENAAEQRCQLVVFSEALLPGYPFWIERTDGAQFNSPIQKEIHAHYLDQAVQIESGHLSALCQAAKCHSLAVVLGCVERPLDRGGHSLYCSLVFIDSKGEIRSVHRKLMPTYEERLTWSPGDGHGLHVHQLEAFTVGGLNCWENWMPLARAALYGLGEDLHIAVWPGGIRNTENITRFIALESRSFVISASGLMRPTDFPSETPHRDLIVQNCEPFLANGGSCIAAPDGTWLLSPVIEDETLLVARLDHTLVRQARQNFDPAGHYSRPDVTHLTVNRKRQSTVSFTD